MPSIIVGVLVIVLKYTFFFDNNWLEISEKKLINKRRPTNFISINTNLPFIQ